MINHILVHTDQYCYILYSVQWNWCVPIWLQPQCSGMKSSHNRPFGRGSLKHSVFPVITLYDWHYDLNKFIWWRFFCPYSCAACMWSPSRGWTSALAKQNSYYGDIQWNFRKLPARSLSRNLYNLKNILAEYRKQKNHGLVRFGGEIPLSLSSLISIKTMKDVTYIM